MRWTCSRFALLLAVALGIWLWPSIVGDKVLLPLDILANNPPHQPDAAGSVEGPHASKERGVGTPHNALLGDWLFENYAWHLHQRRALAGGELPLWDPDTFCGHPLYTSGQTSTFYPLNLILLLLPLPQAYVVFVWAHLFLGGLFTWLLFRRLGVGGFGAAVGGLIFAMSGCFTYHLVFPMLLASGIWLPLILLWMDALAGDLWGQSPFRVSLRNGEGTPIPAHRDWGPRSPRGLLLIVAGGPLLALPALGGFFEIAFYVGAACGLFALVLLVRLAWRASMRAAARYMARLSVAGGLALMLAAPQLIPFFEVMNSNIRAGRTTYEKAVAGGLYGYELLNLIVPDALGNPAVHDSLHLSERQRAPIKACDGADFHYFGPKNYVEVGSYFGLVPLAMAALALRAPGRERLYFLLLVTLALAFALGTPVYRLFFFLVPGAEQVRTPFRWMFLTALGGGYLAAIGAQHWYEQLGCGAGRRTRTIGAALVVVLAILAGVVLAGYYWPGLFEAAAGRLLQMNHRAHATFASADELAGLLWSNAARLAVLLLAAAALLTLGYWRRWTPRSAAAMALAAFALVAIDLGQASFAFNTHADPRILDETPPLIRYLESDRGHFRIGRYGPEKVLYPNTSILYGLQDYGGYDSMILQEYAKFMEAIEPQHLLPYNIVTNFIRRESLDSALLPLLNIRYLLTPGTIDHPDWQRVQVEGTLNLYRVRPERELPRVRLVSRVECARTLDDAIVLMKSRGFDLATTAVVQNPGPVKALAYPFGAPGAAEITGYSMSRVRVATSCQERRLLVLADVMYTGWAAYVDGHRERIYTTNGIFRGVPVTAGQHVVEFHFEPASFRIGAALACLATMIIAVLGAMALLRARRPARQRSAAVSATAL